MPIRFEYWLPVLLDNRLEVSLSWWTGQNLRKCLKKKSIHIRFEEIYCYDLVFMLRTNLSKKIFSDT